MDEERSSIVLRNVGIHLTRRTVCKTVSSSGRTLVLEAPCPGEPAGVERPSARLIVRAGLGQAGIQALPSIDMQVSPSQGWIV